MKAMLLAAGEGVRLRPLTLTTPKPLLEVGGKPLIQRHLERLVAAGADEIVINLHHLGEQIRAFVGDGARFGASVVYSDESELLETGGGVVKALPLLGDAPFILVSADICTAYDFAALNGPLADGCLGHLVMVDNPPHHPGGDFGFRGMRGEATGQLDLSSEPKYNYGGIALLSPVLFVDREVSTFPLRPLFEEAIARGEMTGERFGGMWVNIGTEQQLGEARAALAEG